MIPADTHRVARKILKKGDFGSRMLQKIGELESLTGTQLGLAQKILLAETGTVEQVLSIITGSAVKVEVVEQKEKAGAISRHSLILNGSGKVLIKARSIIFFRNLPARVVSQIMLQESSIGSILTNAGLETFRKIVQVGYDPASGAFFRKYQIIYRRKVAIEITEEIVGIESGPGGI